jgi:hypothetical protein
MWRIHYRVAAGFGPGLAERVQTPAGELASQIYTVGIFETLLLDYLRPALSARSVRVIVALGEVRNYYRVALRIHRRVFTQGTDLAEGVDVAYMPQSIFGMLHAHLILAHPYMNIFARL